MWQSPSRASMLPSYQLEQPVVIRDHQQPAMHNGAVPLLILFAKASDFNEHFAIYHNSMEFHLLVTKGHPFLLTSTPRRGPLCFKHRLGLAQTICWINEMQTIIDQIINGVTYLDMIQNSISINVSMQAPFRKKELQETTTRCLIH